MIITPSAYALTLAAAGNDNLPVILWQNRVTLGSVSADGEALAYPASNLANPSTVLRWQGSGTGLNYLTVMLDGGQPVDALGIARHNFGSGLVVISIEGEEPDAPGVWVEIVAEMVPANDAPLLFRFAPIHLTGIRVKLQPSDVTPRAAVLYVGELLTMERGVQVHTPIPYGRRRTVVTGRSESGDFLGRIITTASLATSAEFHFLTAAWYRAKFDQFADASAAVPFFFAWAPAEYPAEVGYAWLVNDLVPQAADLAGHINVTFDMEGLAL